MGFIALRNPQVNIARATHARPHPVSLYPAKPVVGPLRQRPHFMLPVAQRHPPELAHYLQVSWAAKRGFLVTLSGREQTLSADW